MASGRWGGTSTAVSFAAAGRRIQAFRLAVEQRVPTVNVALLIAEEIKTDVAASSPGHGVPRDTGALAGTLEALGGGRGITGSATLAAGGVAAPYALVQHERLDFQHRLGEPRFLVRGVQRWRMNGSAVLAGLNANVQAAIRVSASR